MGCWEGTEPTKWDLVEGSVALGTGCLSPLPLLCPVLPDSCKVSSFARSALPQSLRGRPGGQGLGLVKLEPERNLSSFGFTSMALLSCSGQLTNATSSSVSWPGQAAETVRVPS